MICGFSYHVEVFHFATIRSKICEVEVASEQNLHFLVLAKTLKDFLVKRRFAIHTARWGLKNIHSTKKNIFYKCQPSCCDKAYQPRPSSVIEGKTLEKFYVWKKRWSNLSCDCPWPTTRYPFWYPSPLSKATMIPKLIVVEAYHIQWRGNIKIIEVVLMFFGLFWALSCYWKV